MTRNGDYLGFSSREENQKNGTTFPIPTEMPNRKLHCLVQENAIFLSRLPPFQPLPKKTQHAREETRSCLAIGKPLTLFWQSFFLFPITQQGLHCVQSCAFHLPEKINGSFLGKQKKNGVLMILQTDKENQEKLWTIKNRSNSGAFKHHVYRNCEQ